MTIFTIFVAWLQILNLPASLQDKNTRVGPFPWKWSVLQNPDRERTNQSPGNCLRLSLPYNNIFYLFSARERAANNIYLSIARPLQLLSYSYPFRRRKSDIFSFLTQINCRYEESTYHLAHTTLNKVHPEVRVISPPLEPCVLITMCAYSNVRYNRRKG